MSRRIGEILLVKGPHINIQVDKNISDLHLRHSGKTYSIGQPGSYLTVGRGHDRHLVLVTMVYKTQWSGANGDLGPTQLKEAELGLPKGHFPYLPKQEELIDRTIVSGILVGTISGQNFEVGVTRLPIVGDIVTLTTENDLEIALKPPKDKSTITIGSFVDSDIQVHLDIDELFGKHTAIVGTTGCGKSYTVAKLLQEITVQYPGANIIIFDLHGEYRNCFEKSKYVRADQLELPAWLHSFEHLFGLCADLSNQFNIHNQRWVFREGLFRLKQRYCTAILKDATLAENIDLDSPIPFSFKHLINYLNNVNSKTLDKKTNKPAYAEGEEHDELGERIQYKPYIPYGKEVGKTPLYGELDRLVLRVESRFRDPRYAFMFQYKDPEKGALEELVRKVTGFIKDSPQPITVFDLSYLPSETVGSVVATLSTILFQVHFLSERRTYVPSLVVYEEAHNYIARAGRGAYGDARGVVERIAKEGRKFGIGVVAVSQRPSELSETLLSQCNSFLCMRLANTVDQNYIIGLLPESMSEMVDILPALPRGHLLAVGQASKMPVRLKVDEIEDESRRPDSDDPKYGEKWKDEIESRSIPDIETVCDLWIRSQRPGANNE